MSAFRHNCADCQTCSGTADQPCSWGEFNDGHTYPECPGAGKCGKPWPGCHHCGAPTPCPEPCRFDPKDANGNPVLFQIGDAA